MKNLFKSLLSFVAVAASFVACNPDQPIDVPAGTVITVDLTQVRDQLASLPATNVPSITFDVTSDGEWLATTPSWITIDPSHATGSTSVTISVADNVDANGKLLGPRTGKITLSLVDAEVSVEIIVEQLGDDSLDTRRTYVKVSEITSGKAYLLVAQKAENTFVVPILFGPTGTYGYPKAKEITFEEDGSIKMEDASYGLIFTDAGRDAAYTIQQPDGRFIWHQGGYNTWSCAADPTEGNLWKLDHVFDDGTVRICDTDAAGVLQYGHGGFDSFSAYGDLDGTSVLPWLYEDTKAAVIDNSKCFFPTASVTVAADSTKATFKVEANIPWELTKTDGDWITDFDPKTGEADATITVTFPANDVEGAEARTAKFHLASKDGKKSADLTLTQASPAVLTLADVSVGEAGEYTVKNVVVVAVGGSNRVIADETGCMLAYGYAANTAEPMLGDKADVMGRTKKYNGVMEWDKPAFTVTAKDTEIKYPQAVTLDEAALEAYAKQPVVEYAVVEGIRNESEYVVLLVGTKGLLVNIYGDMETETGKTYRAYGYTIGYDSGNSKTNFVVTSYEEVAVDYDKFELSKSSAEVEAPAGNVTFTVEAADNIKWSVGVPEDAPAGLSVAVAGADGSVATTGVGTKEVTVSYPENTSNDAVKYQVFVTAEEGSNVALRTLTFAISQLPASTQTFSEITEAGNYVVRNALVVATGGTTTVFKDATGYMFMYDQNKVCKVGEIVNLSGPVASRNNLLQWGNKTAVTKVSSDNEVKHPEAVVLDEAALNAYSSKPVIEYAVVEGVKSGNNLKVGESELLVNIATNERMEEGKTYKAYGYTVGYYGSTKAYLVTTSVEEVKYAKFELSTTADEVEAAAGAKTFQVVADDAVEWSLSIEPAATITIEGLEPNVFASAGTKNVTINYAANESAAPVNYVVTVTTRASVENPTLTYTLTQKGKEGAETLKFEWRNEADTLVNVAFDASDAAHWYVEADPAVEYTFQVLAGNGSVYTESGDGITIENAAGHVAINYVKNTTPYEKVWTIVASTKNENVAVQTLTAKLVQGAYEYSDMAEVNDAIIKAGEDATLSLIINIPEDQPLEVTRIYNTTDKSGKAHKSVFLQNNTGALLLYDVTEPEGISTLYAVNKQIVGKFTVTTALFKGLPEIKKVSCKLEDIKITYPASPKYYCFTRTIAEIEANYPKFVNAKCLIKNVEVTKSFGATKAGEIKDASGTLAIYNYSTDLTVDIPVGSKASKVVVWPTVYNSHQLGFYQADQFGITSIPGQIVMPKTLSVVVGEEGTSLGATAPYGGTITYVSSDDTKATVSDAGVVTGIAAGTATITASVPATTVSFLGANIPVTEATATCEVTVTDEAPAAKEYTFRITTSDFNGTSYAANNNEKTSTAVASDGSTMDVKWTSNQIMTKEGVIQGQKNTGYIYNSTDLGKVTSVEILSNENYTYVIGATEQPTATAEGGFFKISAGSATSKAAGIIITFEK